MFFLKVLNEGMEVGQLDAAAGEVGALELIVSRDQKFCDREYK